MKNESGFESIGDVLKRIMGEKGFQFPEKDQTEYEFLEAEKRYFEKTCELENAKEGDLNEFDGYNCEVCKNKGRLFEPRLNGKRWEITQVKCRCQRARRAIRALKRSGLEDVVQEYRFDNYVAKEPWQKTALEIAKRYTEDYQENWLFIGGASGRGKTHLCTAAAISILKKDKEVKYMLWRDEARRLKSIVNDPQYNEDIQFYKTVDVLYIDDLFKTGRGVGKTAQMPTEADINLAFEIINSRAIQRKPTIISSESTLIELVEIDEAVASRIKQRCGDYYFNIGAKNTKNYRME
jgi:DNA replication protein DnaC